MHIQVKSSALKQTKWYEYLIRFVFGGAITAAAGFIAHQYGPVIGGLFLAFPSIFPASVTLAQSHKQKKEEQKDVSEDEAKRAARITAGLTSLGAAFGSLGLLAFGFVIWRYSLALPPWLVLLIALVVWFVISVVVWWVRGKIAGPETTQREQKQS